MSTPPPTNGFLVSKSSKLSPCHLASNYLEYGRRMTPLNFVQLALPIGISWRVLVKDQLFHLKCFATANVRTLDDAAFVAKVIRCDSGTSIRPREFGLLTRDVPHGRDRANRHWDQWVVADTLVLGVRAVVADFVVYDADVKVVFVVNNSVRTEDSTAPRSSACTPNRHRPMPGCGL